jgi:hypothetical protein
MRLNEGGVMGRLFGTHRRARQVAGLLVVAALAKALLAWSHPSQDVEPKSHGCTPVQGTFTNVFLSGTTVCPTSPISLCTQGVLSGDLVGTYNFTFLTETPVGTGNAPVESFTGMSAVTTSEGAINGHDFGILRTPAFPQADFTTHLRIDTGTGIFEGATGHLTIQGTASFVTGMGSGTYKGVICADGAVEASDDTQQP